MQYRFEELKVVMSTSPMNIAAENMMKRFGFYLEWFVRNNFILNGYAIDGIYYSLLESEWPTAKKAIEKWLLPDNLDAEGKQKKPLR